MFRPIKNLITYIQKNASGTSIFGGSTAETGVIQMTPAESETETTRRDTEKTDCKEAEEAYDEEDLNSKEESKTLTKMEVSDINHKVNDADDKITTTNIPSLVNLDEDDIEMQIKSNTVLRKSIDITTAITTIIDDEGDNQSDNDSSSSVSVKISATKNHDYNQNHEIIDVELEDFRHDPMAVVIEDFCSADSESAAEEENEEAPFLDLTHELDDAFPSKWELKKNICIQSKNLRIWDLEMLTLLVF